MLGNEGVVWIFQLIIAPLTSSKVENTKYEMKNMNSNIDDIATCKTCKM